VPRARPRERKPPPPAPKPPRAATPPSLAERIARRPGAVAATLAALHLALALLAFDPSVFFGGDNGTYVSLARSMLERHAYLEYWDPAQRPYTLYPPVFPAVLALAMTLGVRTFAGFKYVVLAFSCAAVAFSYLWLRRRTSLPAALAAGVVLAAGPGVLALSHLELSDVPFWCFTVVALWAFAHLENAGGRTGDGVGSTGGMRWAAIAGAATATAYLTRSAGLPLLLAALGTLAWRREWRRLAVFAGVALPGVAAWSIRGKMLGGSYTSYLWYRDPYQPALGNASVGDLLTRVLENTVNYTREHVPVLVVGPLSVTQAVSGIGLLLMVLAVTGWARRLRRRQGVGVAEAWVPLYAGILLVWPSTWGADRLALPLLPALLLYAGEATRDVLRRAGRARAPLAAACAAALLLAMVPGIVESTARGAECRAGAAAGDPYACSDEDGADFLRLATALRGRLPAGSVVVARKPTLFFALTGYRSRMYPLSAEPDSFFRAAREAGARFVVVDQVPDLAPLYLAPVLLARRDDFCVVFAPRFGSTALAVIDPSGPRRAGRLPNSFRRCSLAQFGGR
jgi:4-amino-4-deoxy-L-arabinose transferase-like glycosyltransferase